MPNGGHLLLFERAPAAYVNRESLLSEALLAFCVNQGISASFVSSSLLTANSFLISLASPSTLWIPCIQLGLDPGKFPDMRQNERRIKFIRVGDTVRTAGQLKGDPTLNVEWAFLVHFHT